MSTEWTHPDEMTLRDFQTAGLAVPGMLVEFYDERGSGTALIGHVNDMLGTCDDCPENRSARVIRYRRIWSPSTPAPAPSVVPEAAVEAVAPALYEHMRRTTPDGDRYPEWDAESRQAKAWLDYARAALTAALPLLTAAPSATREEVVVAVDGALNDAIYEDGTIVHDAEEGIADALLARFSIAPKEPSDA